MINDNKDFILNMQSIIDTILENQNVYAVDRDLMYKLDEHFVKLQGYNEELTTHYLDFIEIFTYFFDMLLKKLKEYEKELLENKDLVGNCFFEFSFNEFNEKEILMPYKSILNILEDMIPENYILQGIVFYQHLNTLLKRYMFLNNKVGMADETTIIEIDYASRIEYYKEEYITNFRHELEEGVRSGVFLDDDEIIEYIRGEINNLENELNI